MHGMRHCFVEAALIRKVEELWNTDTELVIVTGMSDEMKRIVREVLDEYELEYTEGDQYNNGYIKTIV